MEIMNRESLPESGFAGVREHRIVKDPGLFGKDANSDGSWQGIGSLLYIADARFIPGGEAGMHPHDKVDIISVMVKGRLKHEGSVGNGLELNLKDVMVQTSGAEGFSHNEVNPDQFWNRMLQVWMKPEQSSGQASYKVFHPASGKLTRVYGGNDSPDTPFPSSTIAEVGLLLNSQEISIDKPFLMYIIRGLGHSDRGLIQPGDLIRGDSMKFKATQNTHLLLITTP